MKILYLTFYFEPDLSPGSFRNTSFVNELCRQFPDGTHIHVITTMPNRYESYKPSAQEREERLNGTCRVTIDRVALATHAKSQFNQIGSFITYWRAVHRLIKDQKYKLVFASSSKLFTASLGAKLARFRRIPLFLDIRDLFREGILDIHKNPIIQLALNPALRFIEYFTFRSANHINLVSEGFRFYFKRYPKATYSYFTNGIDDIFLTDSLSLASEIGEEGGEIKTILYAGNIGDGQGLHKIIPQAARQLGDRYRFVVIGDGSARRKLEDALRSANILNVELHKPVDRSELVAEYQKADYLFAHLNDWKVCEHVLPSKLFDYGATDKPILAGVAGYAASFVQEHLNNSLVFAPCDTNSLVNKLNEAPYRTEERAEFRARFQRKTISQEMAQQIREMLKLI